MAYRVERSDGPAARDILLRLWTDNLNMRGEPRHKFDWYYRGNPLGPATAFLLQHTGPEGPPEVVGSCGVGRRTMYVDGHRLTAALFADFTVDKAHRTLMPAMLLQRALCEFATTSHDLAYAFPNDAAVGIFNRIGLKTIGRARRYVKILRTAPLLNERLPVAALARGAAAVLDAGLRLDDLLRSTGRGFRVEWLAGPDQRFDALWDEVRPHWNIVGERSAAFLRWRFTDRPGVPSRFAALVHRRTGRLAAYAAIVEKDPGDALVADFLADTDVHLTLLLRMLGPRLAGEGYARATAYFLGARRIDDAIARAGFRFRNDAKFVIAGAREGAPVAAERLARADDWYLTEADRDN